MAPAKLNLPRRGGGVRADGGGEGGIGGGWRGEGRTCGRGGGGDAGGGGEQGAEPSLLSLQIGQDEK